MMAKQGYLVFSIEYRHLDDTDFFGAVSDVCCGLKFVRDSLQRYNGDPDRIYVVGEMYAKAMRDLMKDAGMKSVALERVE